MDLNYISEIKIILTTYKKNETVKQTDYHLEITTLCLFAILIVGYIKTDTKIAVVKQLTIY